MRTWVFLILILFTATSCLNPLQQAVPLNCEDVLSSKHRHLPFQLLNRSNALSWIASNLGVPEENIDVNDHLDGSRSFKWLGDSRSFNLAIYKSGNSRLNLYLLHENPSLGDFVRCFGVPNVYRASDRINSDAFIFEIWYIDKGVAAQLAKQSSGHSPPKITSETEFTGIVLAQPGTLDQFAGRVYAQLNSQELKTDLLSEVHEWTTQLDEIKVKTR